MLSPHTRKPKAVMQARNKLQQKATEPLAEASKVLEPHAVSSVHRRGEAPDTMSWFVLALGMVLPGDESPTT